MTTKSGKTRGSARRPARPIRALEPSRTMKRHAAPSSRGEGHIGAMENQIGKTLPPRPDDDEPKQG